MRGAIETTDEKENDGILIGN